MAMMAEQIQILGNKRLVFSYLFIVILSFLFSCKDFNSSNDKINNLKKESVIANSPKNSFNNKADNFRQKIDSLKKVEINSLSIKDENGNCDSLDLSLNGLAVLNNSKIFVKKFSKDSIIWTLNDRAYILSLDSTKYASFGVAYGGGIHEYRDVRIVKITSKSIQKYIPKDVREFIQINKPESNNFKPFFFTKSDFLNFISGKGIKLGMTINDLEERISKPYNKQIINDSIVYNYKNDYCLYYENYIVVKNQLIDFSFGFENP